MDENRKFRHELKYQCSEAHLAIIRNRLQGVIPYDRHAANGQYTIRSMYFDNFENHYPQLSEVNHKLDFLL